MVQGDGGLGSRRAMRPCAMVKHRFALPTLRLLDSGDLSPVNHHKLVQPEFLNHQGFLFGGYLLKWVDELAYITAKLEYPENRFVTIALDDVVFKHRITNGQILRFAINLSKRGTTSLQYNVQVFAKEQPESQRIVFETNITFVNVGDSGQKQPI